MNKDRRRTSIHDITTVTNGDTPTPQGPITGQINASVATAGKSAKHSLQSAADPAGVGIFGTTIGQPVVGGPLMPAVGTPVNLPVPAGSHIGYPVRTPASISSTTYQMPPTSSGSWVQGNLEVEENATAPPCIYFSLMSSKIRDASTFMDDCVLVFVQLLDYWLDHVKISY